MSKLFAIDAYDDFYDGRFGIRKREVIEVTSYKEAKEYASETSYEMIQNSAPIKKFFTMDAKEKKLSPNTPEWNSFIDAKMRDCVDYEVHEITKDTNESLEALNEKFDSKGNDFLKEYCGLY